MKSEREWLEIVESQFDTMQEDLLDTDRHILGGTLEEDYVFDNVTYSVWVSGYWEKVTWFDYQIKDSKGEVMYSGTRDYL